MHKLCLLLMLAFLSACSGGQTKVQPPKPKTVALKATSPPTLTPEEEPETMYTCIATGGFNLTSTPDNLLMETWCNTKDGVVRVEDTRVTTDKIPFKGKAFVTIKVNGSKTVVTLSYHEHGESNRVTLLRRPAKEYSYSITELIEPIRERRSAAAIEASAAAAKSATKVAQPPSSQSVCTPDGYFTVSGNEITLRQVCLRVFHGGGGDSFWDGDPLVVVAKQGRHILPFKNAWLERHGNGFELHASLMYGNRVAQKLQADQDGAFSFEPFINRMVEID